MTGSYTRKYVFTWLRKHQPLSTRRFARLDTSLPRAVQTLLLDGEPGDVIEISHADHGFQIATVKIYVNGRFTIDISKEFSK